MWALLQSLELSGSGMYCQMDNYNRAKATINVITVMQKTAFCRIVHWEPVYFHRPLLGYLAWGTSVRFQDTHEQILTASAKRVILRCFSRTIIQSILSAPHKHCSQSIKSLEIEEVLETSLPDFGGQKQFSVWSTTADHWRCYGRYGRSD